MKPVPITLMNNKNNLILSYLDGRSCHSDISVHFNEKISAIKDVHFFCPDPLNFSYCLWHTHDEVIAYAAGMEHIGLKSEAPELINLFPLSEVGYPWILIPYDTDKWDDILLRWNVSQNKE